MIDNQRFRDYLNELLTDFAWNPTDACYYVRTDSPQSKSGASLSAREYQLLKQINDVTGQLDESSQGLYHLLIDYHEARYDVRPEFERAVLRIRSVIRRNARAEIGETEK